MVKKQKKNTKNFQQALLSNADFLKQAPKESAESEKESIISDDVLEKLEILAEYDKINVKELVDKALNHFLRLKGMQLEEAIKTKKQNK